MPVGGVRLAVALDTIGVPFGWWRDSAVRLEAAGYDGIRCWDHFVRRVAPAKPVLECWTTITTVAALTERVKIGPFVANVMNRHPALLARMAATLQEASGGRLVLGMGIGGFAEEHRAYGMPYPAVPERIARLEEAIAVLRALWTGAPVSRDSPFYPLRDAVALPAPAVPPPIVVGAQSATGARFAARHADGWACRPDQLERLLPMFLDALAAEGRSREDVTVTIGYENGRSGEDALAGSAWIDAPAEEAARWRARGVDDVVLLARTTRDVERLVEATARW
jgi:alkanesulfonate monooxygenase SsuD/methylene tetrahydromethanopterin reductase-like flavin-dependent oxidoreductase (luciferase family)